ncbi:MAG: conjugal transfer protein TraF [Sulfuricurvum sp.]|uniref:conjugal transfer protein TraF n=1 Tax=Sulfuricurvum sp. TaxID=2025608 RepID=UPI0027350346|nr:conjugal transfer protein TraF [Sulfuricurvum sp.]MDP3291914.1 conjugal transfer protein TraF [Sulfuricurvum sp.]
MTTSKIVLSFAASACIAVSTSAMEFQVLGAKAAAMGGAGIATSPSSLAAYNNPALLANNPEKFSLHIGGGIGLKDTGAGKAVSDLSDLDFSGVSHIVDGTANTASAEDIATLIHAKNIIVGMHGKGFQLNPTADFGLSFGSFGTGLFVTSDIGAIANVDQTHTALIFAGTAAGSYYDISSGTAVASDLTTYNATSLQYAIDNDLTNLDVLGLAVAEVPLAYGHAFDVGFGTVGVGGSLKLMSGKTFYKSIALDEENSFDNIDQNSVTSSTFGIDLGTTFKPKAVESLTLALVGKNLNSPEFDAFGGRKYEIEPSFRAGGAYKLTDIVEFALDADLTTNKGLTGYDTRYIGGGVNVDLSALEVNVGLMKNTASNDEAGVIYTAGIATGPDWLHFELSAQMASKTGEVEGTSYPKQALVNFAISSAW